MRRILPGIYLLDLELSQAYLWDWGAGLTLIDCGAAGSAPAILDGITSVGRRADQLSEVILTHYHHDHVGGAAELVAHTGARVLAHRTDAPVIRGEVPQTPHRLEEFERALAESILPRVPRASPVQVHREVEDGQTTAGGGVVLSVPGHRPGSMAVYLPESKLLFAGDALARGQPHPGTVQRRPPRGHRVRGAPRGVRRSRRVPWPRHPPHRERRCPNPGAGRQSSSAGVTNQPCIGRRFLVTP